MPGSAEARAHPVNTGSHHTMWWLPVPHQAYCSRGHVQLACTAVCPPTIADISNRFFTHWYAVVVLPTWCSEHMPVRVKALVPVSVRASSMRPAFYRPAPDHERMVNVSDTDGNNYAASGSTLTCPRLTLSNFCESHPLSAGKSPCLDAFAVALKQACDGGERRWYASTRELHRASLAFCRECRSVPTMHVRVDDDGEAPASLWYSRQPHAWPTLRSSRVCVSSRVPVVRAHRLTWELGLDVLLETADFELWTWSEHLQLREPVRQLAYSG